MTVSDDLDPEDDWHEALGYEPLTTVADDRLLELLAKVDAAVVVHPVGLDELGQQRLDRAQAAANRARDLARTSTDATARGEAVQELRLALEAFHDRQVLYLEQSEWIDRRWLRVLEFCAGRRPLGAGS